MSSLKNEGAAKEGGGEEMTAVAISEGSASAEANLGSEQPAEPKVKRGKKKDVILSGFKTALNAEERCSDKCYESMSKHLPGFKKVIDNATPEPLKVLPQAHMCLAVVIFNMILIGFYVFFYNFSYDECLKQEFLSLGGTEKSDFNFIPGYPISVGSVCENVKFSISSSFHLDDAGIWSSKNAFDFTSSMIKVDFRGYSEDITTYRDNNATDIHRTINGWQKDLLDEPWDRTMVKLTQFYDNLQTSRVVVSTDVSPIQLMDTIGVYPTIWKNGLNQSQLFKRHGYDNRINSTMWYEDNVNSFSLWSTRHGIQGTFDQYFDADYLIDDDSIKKGTKQFRVNKFSLWTAAAVNMGILNITDLKFVGWNVTGAPSDSLVDDFTALTDEDDDSVDDGDADGDDYFAGVYDDDDGDSTRRHVRRALSGKANGEGGKDRHGKSDTKRSAEV
eukprot:CAMPEP_0119478258 /NCGR_PEP_ID=MMETSP1344-20130328/8078_1 /TAXON_ID=236787 /ORGANISM="Florenciella parvula, Strain CCMP2471" /LENGTH=444 /DNA_ID=CAMNT_0007512413 /DNA_START=122 /DNA_END=1452 /DNA_ORIENTATION=+